MCYIPALFFFALMCRMCRSGWYGVAMASIDEPTWLSNVAWPRKMVSSEMGTRQ